MSHHISPLNFLKKIKKNLHADMSHHLKARHLSPLKNSSKNGAPRGGQVARGFLYIGVQTWGAKQAVEKRPGARVWSSTMATTIAC
jgi:hypothetical protein